MSGAANGDRGEATRGIGVANADARSGADGFSADVASIRPQFRQTVPSYFALLGHVQTMLEPSDSMLKRQLDRVWAGRTFHVVYDRPLLFLAALRADALIEGPNHPLFRAIAVDAPQPEVTREEVQRALAPERTRFFDMIASRWVQTNETLRSVAWRWPACLAGCDGGARSLALVDLGASAGLNLVAERLPALWTDPSGAALPAATRVRAVTRLGLDLRPVDLTDADNVTWMRACIWPGDRGRGDRLEAALAAWAAARAEGEGPTLERCDVSGFASRVAQVAEEHGDALVLAYQSYLRDYLPPAAREAHRAAMHACLAALAPGRAAWIELEIGATEPRDPEPAAITVHLRAPEGEVRALEIARTFHHPIQVRPVAAAVREVERALWNSRRQGC